MTFILPKDGESILPQAKLLTIITQKPEILFTIRKKCMLSSEATHRLYAFSGLFYT